MARPSKPRGAAAQTQPPPADRGPAPEVIAVHSARIACDGVGGALGHPRVWLQLGSAGFVECPYCDRRFVAAADVAHGEAATPGVYEGSQGH